MCCYVSSRCISSFHFAEAIRKFHGREMAALRALGRPICQNLPPFIEFQWWPPATWLDMPCLAKFWQRGFRHLAAKTIFLQGASFFQKSKILMLLLWFPFYGSTASQNGQKLSKQLMFSYPNFAFCIYSISLFSEKSWNRSTAIFLSLRQAIWKWHNLREKIVL